MRAALCTHPDGIPTAPEIVRALHDAVARLRDAGWIVTELEQLPPMRSVCDTQITLWMGDGFEAMLRAAELEGDAGAIAALSGQARIGRAVTLESFSQALRTRATITREWQRFVETHPVVLLPVSAELPFDANLDLRDADSYTRVWDAQSPMIALPLTGLPCLTLTMNDSAQRPVGIQILAARFREDLCLSAAETIEARGNAVTVALR